MKIQEHKTYAVVTGDVVASSRLSRERRQALHEAMTATSGELREAWPKALLGELDIFRGDGWQMVVARPELALRCALFYRAGLRARMASHRFDVRLALALGTIDFIPGRRVSQGDGEAFRLSGKALEGMRRSEGMRLLFPGCAVEAALDTVVRLVDALAARWSDKQALAVTGALRGWPQDAIGRRCWPRPISQQAVQQHLDRAAWNGLDAGLAYFEAAVLECAER
jgi:hypothetical protein